MNCIRSPRGFFTVFRLQCPQHHFQTLAYYHCCPSKWTGPSLGCAPIDQSRGTVAGSDHADTLCFSPRLRTQKDPVLPPPSPPPKEHPRSPAAPPPAMPSQQALANGCSVRQTHAVRPPTEDRFSPRPRPKAALGSGKQPRRRTPGGRPSMTH